MLGFEIIGTGHYVPGPPVTNADLSRVMDTSDEWIFQRSGIRQRHFAPEGSGCSDFAVEASKAVPWTKPADIPFDKDKKVSLDFGKAYGEKPLGAMMDGSVRTLDLKKIKPETLKNAIMPDDGNVLGADWKE